MRFGHGVTESEEISLEALLEVAAELGFNPVFVEVLENKLQVKFEFALKLAEVDLFLIKYVIPYFMFSNYSYHPLLAFILQFLPDLL